MDRPEKNLRGVVAVDGPSGTGKSTTARGLASRLAAHYLDTGAMYRAATLAVLRAGLPLDPESIAERGDDAVVATAVGAPLWLSTDPREPRVHLGADDVGAEIRGPAVTRAVSTVSALTAVREHLVAKQRRIVAEAADAGHGIVVEGRDIGTVVVPDAPLKVYLVASDGVRADRRTAQNGEGSAGDTRLDLARRDRLDSSRAASPLSAAADAVVVDTSTMDIDGVLARLEELAAERGLLADARVGAHGG